MPEYGAGDGSGKDIPLAHIADMQRKGLTNNQIIQTLQRDGFTTSQVFDALNQANMQPTMPGGEDHMMPEINMPPPSAGRSYPQSSFSGSNEEMIEAIVDEKWNELVKDIRQILAWKEYMTQQLARLDQRITGLQGEFDKLHEGVIGKVGEYDKNIQLVGAEVKAMEKVFSKVLPVFTENVAELSRITDKVKNQK